MNYYPSLICVNTSSNAITICISSNNFVYSFGTNINNAHGHNDYNVYIPKQINKLLDIKMISCGGHHTLSLNYNGDVFSFGKNNHGQLGINPNKLEKTHIPHKINLPPCKYISCGDLSSLCNSCDGYLYTFGDNGDAQLGLGDTNSYDTPQIIPNLNNVDFIECGGLHCICKTQENNIYSWGSNNSGELGNGNTKKCKKPVQCLNWPDNIIDIKCGYSHTLLLTLDGYVYVFGRNNSGQLGIDVTSSPCPILIDSLPEIQKIGCGDFHSMCIDINNNLWIFGSNDLGQLGLGDKENRYKPILHPTLSDIIDISSGGDFTFVKSSDNKIYAFGKNNAHQLGIKNNATNNCQLIPKQTLIDNEDIWCSRLGKSRQKSARK